MFRPLAHVVVLVLAPLRVPPPVVVLVSAACGVAGAVELARGHLFAAVLLVQLKTVLDNADGQLARLTNRVTVFGRYLDSECDLFVNAALFAGLGWYTGRPLAAALGFVALTAVLSVNFNLERLARGAQTSSDSSTGGAPVRARTTTRSRSPRWHSSACRRSWRSSACASPSTGRWPPPCCRSRSLRSSLYCSCVGRR